MQAGIHETLEKRRPVYTEGSNDIQDSAARAYPWNLRLSLCRRLKTSSLLPYSCLHSSKACQPETGGGCSLGGRPT